jgi:hypothetical protein
MTRREFISLLGGAAAWPLTARAQQPAMPVVGLLSGTSAAPFQHLVAALRQGLSDEGFVEGCNVTIEQRWADNRLDRLAREAAPTAFGVTKRTHTSPWLGVNHGSFAAGKPQNRAIPVAAQTSAATTKSPGCPHGD